MCVDRVHVRKERIRLPRLLAPHADTRFYGNVSYRPRYPTSVLLGLTTRITRPGDPNRRRCRKASPTKGNTLLVLALALLVSLSGLQAQPPQVDSPTLGKSGYLPAPAVTPDRTKRAIPQGPGQPGGCRDPRGQDRYLCAGHGNGTGADQRDPPPTRGP